MLLCGSCSHSSRRRGPFDRPALRFGFCPGFFLLLRAGGRISRAFLAADMLAVDADLVRSIGRLASVTDPTDPHANRLLHPFHVQIARGHPFMRFQRQSVLGEQSSSSFLLRGTPMRSTRGGILGRRRWIRGGRRRLLWILRRCPGWLRSPVDSQTLHSPYIIVRNHLHRGSCTGLAGSDGWDVGLRRSLRLGAKKGAHARQDFLERLLLLLLGGLSHGERIRSIKSI